MNIEEDLKEMKIIQEKLLNFLESDDNEECYYQQLHQLLNNLQIQNDKYNFKSFLIIISKISDNHYRGCNLIIKIEQILHVFRDYITKYLKNSEIFKIFKNNKRILLFLIEEKIITFDKYIADELLHNYEYVEMSYPAYFASEIRPYINLKEYNDESEFEFIEKYFIQELPTDFYEKRKNGENDSYICQLIREDSVEEFITYVNRNNVSLDSTINPSIFETNIFLFKNENVSLIEYAAFFGSIQIFQYLQIKNVKLNPSLIIYGIHSKNAEMIHLIEEKNNTFSKNEDEYLNCLKESIKCHHNNITNYFTNFLSLNKEGNLHVFQIKS